MDATIDVRILIAKGWILEPSLYQRAGYAGTWRHLHSEQQEHAQVKVSRAPGLP